MSKIDLLDQKWIDLVFEGKNEAYGAYAIRQDTNKRNLYAMLALFAGIIAIVGSFLLVNVASEAIAAAQAEQVRYQQQRRKLKFRYPIHDTPQQ